jgi:hypothetical protein
MQGRTLAEWTAREVAGVLTQITTINKGLAVINDVWPQPEPEPTRRDQDTAAPTGTPPPPEAGSPHKQGGGTDDGPREPPSASSPEIETPPGATRPKWQLPADMLGQDNIVKALGARLAEATTLDEVAQVETLNAERIGKFTGLVRTNWNNAVRTRREMLTP